MRVIERCGCRGRWRSSRSDFAPAGASSSGVEPRSVRPDVWPMSRLRTVVNQDGRSSLNGAGELATHRGDATLPVAIACAPHDEVALPLVERQRLLEIGPRVLTA